MSDPRAERRRAQERVSVKRAARSGAENLTKAEHGDAVAATFLAMSEWGESRRDLMTPRTIGANHRLHMTRECPTHGFVWTLVDDRGAHVCQVCGDVTK